MWHVKIIRVNDFAGVSEILQAHLKFCWHGFEAKVAPAKEVEGILKLVLSLVTSNKSYS
jgi:hypothetical protein